MIDDKGATTVQWGKDSLSINGTGSMYIRTKKNKPQASLHMYILI